MKSKEIYRQQIEINSDHINPQVREFNAAIKNYSEFLSIIEKVLEQRPTITPLHFGLLIQAACQYIWLENQENWNNISKDEISWAEILPKVIKNHQKELIELCARRNIAITVPQRYFVLKATTNFLLGEGHVVIFDVGSGFIPCGIGAIFSQQTEYFPIPSDKKSVNLIQPLLEKPFLVKKVVCTDIQSPDPTWAAACYWLPLKDLNSLKMTFQKKASQPLPSSLEFRLFDITSLDRKPITDLEGSVDLVMMSNLLYQLAEKEQKNAFSNIAALLKPTGWLLSLEYLPDGSRRRPFTFGALVYPRLKSDKLGKPLEIFRLDSADCKQIKVGRDFLELAKLG